MRTMLALSLALALFAVGCTLEDNLKQAEDDNADLTAWVAERKEDYAKFEAAKDSEAAKLKTTIEELRAAIEKLKMPALRPGGPTLEELQRTMATARERLEALGAVLLDTGRPAPARDALLVARQLGATKPAVFFMLGRASADTKMDEAAEENFRLAVAALEKQADKDVPLTVRCLLARGAALRRLGDSDKAVAEWQKALKLNPKNAAAHYNLGLVYTEDPKQQDAAIEALRKYITLGGDRTVSAREMIEKLLEPPTEP